MKRGERKSDLAVAARWVVCVLLRVHVRVLAIHSISIFLTEKGGAEDDAAIECVCVCACACYRPNSSDGMRRERE